jgi:hypothetical protein
MFVSFFENLALVNLEELLEYQSKNPSFAEKIVIRKIKNIINCRNMLRLDFYKLKLNIKTLKSLKNLKS